MRKIRANTQSLGVAGAAALTILFAGSPAMAAESDPQDYTQIERGRYLAVASDCSSCHTVPGSDRPFAGGRPIETPFGNIVAPNITPDRDTGIGAWSDDEFERAVRKGVRRGGWLLYPAMPYNAFTKMSRDDVLAIRAYLNTVTPASNAVVANTLPFPFNIRAAMRVWNALYFTEGEYTPDPQKSSEWNRGRFLVDGSAHCGACHTPKSLLGGDKMSQYLEGSFLQGWFAPNITNDRRTRRLVGRRRGCLPQDRAQPRHRGDRTDGGGNLPVVFTHERRRSQGDRDLFEIAARQKGGSEAAALR
jgi:mono/diheme cytochrome c family protein